jgi:thiol-disulfide isomerase/thioredoxin
MQTGRSSWFVVVIFLAAIFILAYVHREGVKALLRTLVFGQQTPVRAHLAIGQTLPTLDLLNLLGSRDTITAEPGHVLVLNVFATWCPDCIAEAPALGQLRDAYAAKPVDIIGIDQNEFPQTVLRFARDYNWSFPIYIDDSHQTQRLLGVHYIPATFVVDDRGRVWANVAGPLTLEQMEQLVQTGLSHLSVAARK